MLGRVSSYACCQHYFIQLSSTGQCFCQINDSLPSTLAETRPPCSSVYSEHTLSVPNSRIVCTDWAHVSTHMHLHIYIPRYTANRTTNYYPISTSMGTTPPCVLRSDKPKKSPQPVSVSALPLSAKHAAVMPWRRLHVQRPANQRPQHPCPLHCDLSSQHHALGTRPPLTNPRRERHQALNIVNPDCHMA